MLSHTQTGQGRSAAPGRSRGRVDGQDTQPCAHFEALEPRLLLSGDIAVTVDLLVTADPTPRLTGTVGDADAAVHVTVNGETHEAGNNGFGKWTLPAGVLSALAEGTYDVLAVAANGAEGTSGNDDSAGELTVDQTAPVVTVDGRVTSDRTPALSGTVNETDAQLWVAVGGDAYSAVNNGDGTWTLPDDTVVELQTGTYNVTVTATDPAGNEGTDASTDELTIGPAVVVTVDTLTTQDTTPELAGTVNGLNATVVVTVAGKMHTATNNADGTWTLADNTLAALPDGTYDVIARAADPDTGIEAYDGTTDELTVDTSVPVVTVAPLETAATRPELSGTISEPTAAVWVTVDGETYRATNDGSGTWTVWSGTVHELENGTYDLAVVATDPAGNTSTDATTDELKVRPDLSVSISTLTTNEASPKLTGWVSDPDAEVQVTVGSVTYDATNNGDGTWTVPDGTIGPLAEGNHEVLVVAQNPAEGSYATDNVQQDLVIDLTAPTVTISPLATDDTTPELNGTVGDDAIRITVTVNGRDYTAYRNYDDQGDPDGTWTLADNVISPLPGGTYDVAVTAEDAAGNEGTDATTDELTIDSDVILVTVDERATSDTTPWLTGQVGDPAATVQVTVNGSTHTATNNGDGTWTLPDGTLAPLAEGMYDVVAVAANAIEGTSGNDATANELTVDHTPPVVLVTPLTTTDTTPALTGTVNEDQTTIVLTVGGADYPVTNNDDGTWTLENGPTWVLENNEVAELPYGTHNVVVTATDQAGNVGTDTTAGELVVQPELEVRVDERVTDDPTPELTGEVSDPAAVVQVVLDGVTYPAVNNGDGTWTVADNTVARLTDGTYHVFALATNDAFGIFAYDPTSHELTVDTTAPAVTVSAQKTTDRTPGLTGLVTDPSADVRVTVAGREYPAANNADGTWVLPDNATPMFLGAPVSLDYGTYDVAVVATDAAGNVGTDGTANELTVRPEVQVTVDDRVTRDTTPELTGTVNDPNAEIRVTVDGVTYPAVNNGDGTWTLPDGTTPALEPADPAPGEDAVFDVLAVAIDPDTGATGSDATTDELVIDQTAPEVTVDLLETGDTTPPLSGTVDDPDASVWVTLADTAYKATVDGGTWTVADNRVAELGYGTHNVAVTATDRAGNAGTDITAGELVVVQAPQVSVKPLRTNDTTPGLSGRVDDPAATVLVTVEGRNYAAVNNGDTTWTLPNDTLAALEDGTYDVLAVATSASGKNGSDLTADELVIETVPPQVAVDTIDGVALDGAAAVTTSDTTPGFAGSVMDSNPSEADLVVTVGGQDYDAEFIGYELNENDEWEGRWTLDDDAIDPLVPGTYDVTVTATDEAGNVTTETLPGALIVSRTPTVAVDTLTTDDPTPALTGTIGTPDADVAVTVNGSTYAAINYGDGTWRVPDNTVAKLDLGTYDVAVTATHGAEVGTDDTADELAVIAKRTVTVDPLVTAQASPPLSGTVNDPDALVEIQVDDQVYETENNGDGTWTLAEGVVSALTPGTYDVIARATHRDGAQTYDQTAGELLVAQETSTTLTLTLAHRGRAKYQDPDKTTVKIFFYGKKGSVTLTFASNSPIDRRGDSVRSETGVTLLSMIFNADTDQVKIKTGGGADRGTTIGFIGGNADVKKLRAPGCDLIDGGIYMESGIIRHLDVRSIQQTAVAMGGSYAKGIRIRVRQNIEGTNIRIVMSSVRSFMTGSMLDSSLLVNTLDPGDANGDGVIDLPEGIHLFRGFELRSFKITGYKGAPDDLFVNSSVAASEMGTLKLANAVLDNHDLFSEEPVPFGITAHSLRKLSLSQDRVRYKWPTNWLADPEEFEVRVG